MTDLFSDLPDTRPAREAIAEGAIALPGFALADCSPITGDLIEHTVAWKSGSDLRKLAGQAIRLKFELKDADVFAMKFNA